MQFTMKLTAWMMAGILALGMFAPAANAVSLPCVDDANDWGRGKVIATVTACGHESKFTMHAYDLTAKRPAKVKKCKKRVWTCVMKRGHVYRFTVKAKDGKRYNKRSIAYCVY